MGGVKEASWQCGLNTGSPSNTEEALILSSSPQAFTRTCQCCCLQGSVREFSMNSVEIQRWYHAHISILTFSLLSYLRKCHVNKARTRKRHRPCKKSRKQTQICHLNQHPRALLAQHDPDSHHTQGSLEPLVVHVRLEKHLVYKFSLGKGASGSDFRKSQIYRRLHFPQETFFLQPCFHGLSVGMT